MRIFGFACLPQAGIQKKNLAADFTNCPQIVSWLSYKL
jgi:hypothetical protein